MTAVISQFCVSVYKLLKLVIGIPVCDGHKCVFLGLMPR